MHPGFCTGFANLMKARAWPFSGAVLLHRGAHTLWPGQPGPNPVEPDPGKQGLPVKSISTGSLPVLPGQPTTRRQQRVRENSPPVPAGPQWLAVARFSLPANSLFAQMPVQRCPGSPAPRQAPGAMLCSPMLQTATTHTAE